MIELELESKVYAGRRVLGPLSLQLRAGELLCLLGPSGCGKTTLLNVLAGLDRDWQGRLTLGDGRGSGRVGFMFQEPRLLPWRTVRQNLALVGQGDCRARITTLLELMELEAFADHYPGQLSLGMARRVALARTLLNRPELILLDEPFVSLDPPTAAQLGAMLGRLRREQPEVAMVMVTHDLREALNLADRILILGGSPTRVMREFTPAGGRAMPRAEEQSLLDCYGL